MENMCLLVVCGAINWDISCFVDHLPMPGEEVTVKHIIRVSGGTGGNVAVAAARILGAGKVALIGALGEDDIARQQLAAFKAEGIITEGVEHLPGEESGQAYILIDQTGQNVIASHLGANARLETKHLQKLRIREQLEQCQALVITDPPLDVVAELINLAKKRGIPLLWDPGILINQCPETLPILAQEADVLFLNETEAQALLGTNSLNASLQCLKKLGFFNYIVLKLGARGAVIVCPTSNTAIEIPALPIEKLGMQIVNTVGCGDAFAGAFAAYYVMTADVKKSLLMATAAAGFNATRVETRGSPDRVTLEKIVNDSLKLGFAIQERKLA